MFRGYRCVACGNKSGDRSELRFFRFPRNEKRCRQWVEITGLSNLKLLDTSSLNENCRLCSVHFDDSQFKDGTRKKLLSNAVPSHFQDLNYVLKERDTSSITDYVECSDYSVGASPGNWSKSIEELTILASNLCRLCAEQSSNLVSVFEEEGRKIGLRDKIHTHLPIKVTEQDILPVTCCGSCISKLEMCHSFVLSCLDASAKLHSILGLNDTLNVENTDCECENEADSSTLVDIEHYEDSSVIDKNGSFIEGHTGSKIGELETDDDATDIRNAKAKEDEALKHKNTFEESGLQTSDHNIFTENKLDDQMPMSRELEISYMSSKSSVNIVPENSFTGSVNCHNLKTPKRLLNSIYGRYPHVKSTGKQLMCGTCHLNFSSRRSLHRHNMAVHFTFRYKCYLCGKRFKKQKNWKVHTANHKKNYTCKICCETLNSYHLMISHRRSHINNVGKVTEIIYSQSHKIKDKCPDIGSVSPFECSAQQNTSALSELSETNEINYSSSAGDLENEEESFSQTDTGSAANLYGLSEVELSVSCETNIDYANSGVISTTVYENNFHSLQKNVAVPINSYPRLLNIVEPLQFDSVNNARTENVFQEPEIVEAVNSIKQECLEYSNQIAQVECDKTALEGSSMHEIVSIVDVEDAQLFYHCTHCNRIFTTEHAFRQHIQSHGIGRKFLCSVCNREFSFQWALDSHLRTHSDVKPFACQYCNEKFLFRRSLVVHERNHSITKTYTCDVCQKDFSSLPKMKQHILMHSGDWPFRCTYCAKHFKRKEALKSHMLKHANELKLFSDKRGIKDKVVSSKNSTGSVNTEHLEMTEQQVIFGDYGASEIIIDTQADCVPQHCEGSIITSDYTI